MTSTDARPEVPGALRTQDWFRSATRWTQLTFTDDDPATFDVDFWIDVMQRSQSNALCLSAGGYMAFYPTAIPHHRRSVHLGDTDPFGALVDGARALGMHVMARVDPHAIHDDVAQQRPEWLARDVEGNPVPHASMPGLWLTDPFTSYHREFVTDIAVEIVEKYDVDAIFANRWEGHGAISYSPAADQRFHADTGLHLPRQDDPEDPAWERYPAWRSRQLSELVVLWDDAVRAVKPHVRFIPNRGAQLTRDLVRELVDDRYPMFFVDKQGRSGLEASWVPGQIAKRARGLYPDRPVALITSVGPEDNALRWKDSVADPHETVSLIVDGFAHGARPWFTKFKADSFDTRWVEPIVEAFGLHERCEPVLENLQHTAEVVLLDVRGLAVSAHPAAPSSYGPDAAAHENGFYQALIEARIPFEYLAAEALSLDRLEDVRVLILPSGAGLPAAQIAVIEEFVAHGGSVVAAFDAGLDTSGAEPELALGGLLGVRLAGEVRGPLKNKYMTLESKHEITRGYEGAQRIVAGSKVVDVAADEGTDVVLRFVPDYPDLPMEEVYPRPGEALPAVVTRERLSGGRTVYLAGNIGEIYWDALQSDHGRLIANVVRWAAGHRARVEVSGRGLIDLAVHEGSNELAVTVVNLTNPMAMRGQQHELIPLTAQEVSIELPLGVSDVRATRVVADHEVPVRVEGSRARVTIDDIERLEVIHFTWTAAS